MKVCIFRRHTKNDAIFSFGRHAPEYMEILLKTCGRNWSPIFVERAVNGVRVGLQKMKERSKWSKDLQVNDNYESEAESLERSSPVEQHMEKKRKSDRNVKDRDGEVNKKRR